MNDWLEDLFCLAFIALAAIVIALLVSVCAYADNGRDPIVIQRAHHASWNDRQNGLVFAPATFPVCRGLRKSHRVRVGAEGQTQGRGGLVFVGYEISY